MWFWSADSLEQELFDLYAPALRSLGVNFSDEQLQDTLEASSYGLARISHKLGKKQS
ncbi:hypothetical protein [Nostoc sp.]|uniref:hypothetical protein n=1 Tax=Nostoc sp. TaxID=1180 RepID=UPI002FFB989A